jgi:hypothetical protein
LNVGVAYDGEFLFDIENEFKWTIKHHVNAYLGLKYSIDGWQSLFGIKIAGIKFKIPFILIDNKINHHSDDKNVAMKFISVFGIFVGGTYVLKLINSLMDHKKVAKWKSTNLLNLKNK